MRLNQDFSAINNICKKAIAIEHLHSDQRTTIARLNVDVTVLSLPDDFGCMNRENNLTPAPKFVSGSAEEWQLQGSNASGRKR